MANKEFGGKPGFTPKGGAFSETAVFVRELDRQGLLNTPEKKDHAQKLVNQSYYDTMFAQMQGFDVGYPEELPEHSKIFPDATNPDGTVNFSNHI